MIPKPKVHWRYEPFRGRYSVWAWLWHTYAFTNRFGVREHGFRICGWLRTNWDDRWAPRSVQNQDRIWKALVDLGLMPDLALRKMTFLIERGAKITGLTVRLETPGGDEVDVNQFGRCVWDPRFPRPSVAHEIDTIYATEDRKNAVTFS